MKELIAALRAEGRRRQIPQLRSRLSAQQWIRLLDQELQNRMSAQAENRKWA